MRDIPLRLVIFDVDGTLIDSQAHILASMEWTFTRAGLPVPARAEALGIVGLSLPEAMEVLAPDASVAKRAELVTRYKESFAHLRQNGAPPSFFPGALEAIRALDAAGYLMSVATGKSRRGLDRLLDQADLRRYIIGGQTADDAPSKPHPQMVLNCLAATGAAPENAVMVGDTEFDMHMGASAGCHTIGVDWGYHPRARVASAPVSEIISDFDALIPALDRIWGGA